jgi:hypothetical protein
MNEQFKVGDYLKYGRRALAYVIATSDSRVHCLFFDGSHDWHFRDSFILTSKKWSRKYLRRIAKKAFKYFKLDNLTYLELMAKTKNERIQS